MFFLFLFLFATLNISNAFLILDLITLLPNFMHIWQVYHIFNVCLHPFSPDLNDFNSAKRLFMYFYRIFECKTLFVFLVQLIGYDVHFFRGWKVVDVAFSHLDLFIFFIFSFFIFIFLFLRVDLLVWKDSLFDPSLLLSLAAGQFQSIGFKVFYSYFFFIGLIVILTV